jgi:uncharacterized surface protein with fasciclin (FAS1) repeats
LIRPKITTLIMGDQDELYSSEQIGTINNYFGANTTQILAGTVESLLLPENKDKLIAVLTYHVVSGKIMSADIAGKTAEVESVEGSMISVNAMNGVMVDNAHVVVADIETDNGVIHVIDAVILPGS